MLHDNIGLVWRKNYTSKKGQFEDVTIIHCTTASRSLGHPCLVSLLFMASLYPTLFNSKKFYLLVSFPLFYPNHMHGVQYKFWDIMPIYKVASRAFVFSVSVCHSSHNSFTPKVHKGTKFHC